MKLKSYIRGIGIGIIVTSAVFLVSGMNDKNKAMTDAEVIARAKELGYVESTTLAEMSNVVGNEQDENEIVAAIPTTEVETATPATEPESVTPTAEPESVTPTAEPESVTPTAEPEENQDEAIESTEPLDETVEAVENDKEPAVTPKADKEPVTTVTDGDSEDVVIVVNPGDGSDRVAKKLFDAGLVPNAYEFDQFLMANGYDRKITTGNHIISRMATGDEIGKNLVSPTK